MNSTETDNKTADLKALRLPSLLALAIDEKRQLVVDAAKYRSGEDSIGSFYMGGMAIAGVTRRLGGTYGIRISKLVETATEKQIDNTIDYVFHYIDYMQKHPVGHCPQCGQIIAKDKT